jgi:hypothetical protein
MQPKFLGKLVSFCLAFSAIQYPFVAILTPGMPGRELILSVPIMIGAIYYSLFRATAVELRASVMVTLVFSAAIAAYFSFNELPYNPDKVNYFFIALLLFGALTGTCFLDEQAKQYLPFALAILGLILGVALALGASYYQTQRLTLNDANPIWMARALAFSITGLHFLCVKYPKLRLICITEIVILLIGIFYTGSRGPLLSCVTAGIVLHLAYFRTFPSIRVIFTVLSGASVLYLTLGQLITEYLLQFRAFNTFDDSKDIRVQCLYYSLTQILSSFEGLGIGSFFFNWLTYPHNIFLEFLYEWGWIFGAFMSTAIILAPLGFISDSKRNSLLLALFAMDITNASISGDITSPRILYGLVFLGYVRLLSGSAASTHSRRVDLKANLVP